MRWKPLSLLLGLSLTFGACVPGLAPGASVFSPLEADLGNAVELKPGATYVVSQVAPSAFGEVSGRPIDFGSAATLTRDEITSKYSLTDKQAPAGWKFELARVNYKRQQLNNAVEGNRTTVRYRDSLELIFTLEVPTGARSSEVWATLRHNNGKSAMVGYRVVVPNSPSATR